MEMSVIVPCYNSMPILRELIVETIRVLEEMGIKEYEFILVNDGSPNPNTIGFLKSLAEEFHMVKVVNLAKNTGQSNAQLAALNYTTGEYVVNMDDDMQTHPMNIPILYNKINEGYDVVLGSYTKKKHSFFRNMLTKMDNGFEEIFIGKPKGINFTSFWITRRYIVDEIIKYKNPYSFMEGLFIRTAGKIANVEIQHFERQEGQSGYNLKKLIKLWSNFTGFTIIPLRIANGLGIITGIVGVIYAIITVIKKILDPTMVIGYASTISLMLIFFGITLFCMGMLGEYVGRIFMCVNNTPQYVVQEVISFENDAEESNSKEERSK